MMKINGDDTSRLGIALSKSDDRSNLIPFVRKGFFGVILNRTKKVLTSSTRSGILGKDILDQQSKTPLFHLYNQCFPWNDKKDYRLSSLHPNEWQLLRPQ